MFPSEAYEIEEEAILKTGKVVPKDEVPDGANIVNSHTIYKVKVNNDASHKMKARISPHGN